MGQGSVWCGNKSTNSTDVVEEGLKTSISGGKGAENEGRKQKKFCDIADYFTKLRSGGIRQFKERALTQDGSVSLKCRGRRI